MNGIKFLRLSQPVFFCRIIVLQLYKYVNKFCFCIGKIYEWRPKLHVDLNTVVSGAKSFRRCRFDLEKKHQDQVADRSLHGNAPHDGRRRRTGSAILNAVISLV